MVPFSSPSDDAVHFFVGVAIAFRAVGIFFGRYRRQVSAFSNAIDEAVGDAQSSDNAALECSPVGQLRQSQLCRLARVVFAYFFILFRFLPNSDSNFPPCSIYFLLSRKGQKLPLAVYPFSLTKAL